jgi:hypothetical protein
VAPFRPALGAPVLDIAFGADPSLEPLRLAQSGVGGMPEESIFRAA